MTKRRLSTAFLFVLFVIGTPASGQGGETEAYQYLNNKMDEFINDFDVFTDLAAAGNHFVSYCAMTPGGTAEEIEAIAQDETCTQDCHAGATCIKATFSPLNSTFWGGWYYLNGVLTGSETAPSCNWGTVPDAGFDLTGATQLTFWAKGAQGGEKIEFFVGGVGWDATTGAQLQPYPESFKRTPAVGTITTLTNTWQKYTINLSGKDISYVLGGFAWVANVPNNPNGATFYLDDVEWNLPPRSDQLRFIVSYTTLPDEVGDNFDTIMKNVAFTYDNAVALLAYLSRGTSDDLRRAGILADSFVYALEHDRYYSDHRLRSAYQGGDLILWPGWTPNGREGTARIPGWWGTEGDEFKWLEDDEQVGTSTGNMAWVMIGLLRAYTIFHDDRYLTAAEDMGKWINKYTDDSRGAGGYTGGFLGWEPDPEQQWWKSTEHNIDLYVAFMTLYDITQQTTWQEGALHAKRFVESMWGACDIPNQFATGTDIDGETPNCGFHPEDTNTWGLMALGEVKTYGAGIDWVQDNCELREASTWYAKGIDFNDDMDGIWWEGTAHTVIAKMIKGEYIPSKSLLSHLRKAQTKAPNSDGYGIVAALHDGVSTGMDWDLYNRLHVAATSWYILAEQNWNPYWWIRTRDQIPHEGE